VKTHLSRKAIPPQLLEAATERLAEYAKSSDLKESYWAHALRNRQPDGKVTVRDFRVTDGKIVPTSETMRATRLVARVLANVIEAEGPDALADCERPNWAKNILARDRLLWEVSDNYTWSAADMEKPNPIDRTSPAWMHLSRRNITLPVGLFYEVEAVRNRLATSDPPRKISFSGILEVALRELLKRPVDEDDARFYDEEIGDFDFEPEELHDDRTISDVVSKSQIRGRRRSVSQEGA
jgi:hypothetical protein